MFLICCDHFTKFLNFLMIFVWSACSFLHDRCIYIYIYIFIVQIYVLVFHRSVALAVDTDRKKHTQTQTEATCPDKSEMKALCRNGDSCLSGGPKARLMEAVRVMNNKAQMPKWRIDNLGTNYRAWQSLA